MHVGMIRINHECRGLRNVYYPILTYVNCSGNERTEFTTSRLILKTLAHCIMSLMRFLSIIVTHKVNKEKCMLCVHAKTLFIVYVIVYCHKNIV